MLEQLLLRDAPQDRADRDGGVRHLLHPKAVAQHHVRLLLRIPRLREDDAWTVHEFNLLVEGDRL